MLDVCAKNRHPCLVPDLTEKAFSLPLPDRTWATDAIYEDEDDPPYLWFVDCFHPAQRCWVCIDCSPCPPVTSLSSFGSFLRGQHSQPCWIHHPIPVLMPFTCSFPPTARIQQHLAQNSMLKTSFHSWLSGCPRRGTWDVASPATVWVACDTQYLLAEWMKKHEERMNEWMNACMN